MNPFGRRLAAGMNADRHVQLLSLGPEGVVIRVGVRLVGRGEGHKKGPLGAASDRPFELARRLLGVAKGNMGNGDEAAVRVGAEVHHPAVVGPRVGGLQLQVVYIFGFPGQPQGRIDDGLVQTVPVEQRDPLLGVH